MWAVECPRLKTEMRYVGTFFMVTEQLPGLIPVDLCRKCPHFQHFDGKLSEGLQVVKCSF